MPATQTISRRTRWTIGLVALIAIITLIVLAATRAQRIVAERRIQREHERVLNEFKDIKTNGKNYAMVFSPELLVMLGSDADCARKLTYIHFDMTDLNAAGYEKFAKFSNVNKISFYDCPGIEKLLSYARTMPSLNEVYFDYIQTTDALLQKLAAIPNLKTVKFNDADNGQVDAFARALPNVKIKIADDNGN